MAQQPTNNVAAGWLDRATLSGKWNGARTIMENSGVDFSAHFVTESAMNPVGGFRQTARYTQQIDFGVDLDLSRLVGDSGGKIQILLLDRAGRSLSADAIGNQFAVQELYGAGQNFRLVELNYEQSVFAEKVSFHLGWVPAGNYFASLPVFCDFQNGFICAHATPMTTNSGAHNYPVGQWGGHMKLEPTREFYVQTGVFQVNPNEGNSNRGFDLSLGGTGAFVPFEIGWLPGKDTGTFPGIL